MIQQVADVQKNQVVSEDTPQITAIQQYRIARNNRQGVLTRQQIKDDSLSIWDLIGRSTLPPIAKEWVLYTIIPPAYGYITPNRSEPDMLPIRDHYTLMNEFWYFASRFPNSGLMPCYIEEDYHGPQLVLNYFALGKQYCRVDPVSTLHRAYVRNKVCQLWDELRAEVCKIHEVIELTNAQGQQEIHDIVTENTELQTFHYRHLDLARSQDYGFDMDADTQPITVEIAKLTMTRNLVEEIKNHVNN